MKAKNYPFAVYLSGRLYKNTYAPSLAKAFQNAVYHLAGIPAKQVMTKEYLRNDASFKIICLDHDLINTEEASLEGDSLIVVKRRLELQKMRNGIDNSTPDRSLKALKY